MLISSKAYFKQLLEVNSIREEYTNAIQRYISNGIVDNDIVLLLNNETENKTISFYRLLISKLHKIINELLSNEPKTACSCIKTITSLITQATITLEKQFNNDLESANEFIDCVGLKELSNALYNYFSTGDISDIEQQLLRVKMDVEFVKNNLCV